MVAEQSMLAFVDAEGIFGAVGRGDSILIRSSFFATLHRNGGRIPRRQDIESDTPDAIVSAKELRRMYQHGRTVGGFRAMPVIVVSYCWASREHPDPEAHLLAALVDLLANEERKYRERGFRELAVF